MMPKATVFSQSQTMLQYMLALALLSEERALRREEGEKKTLAAGSSECST
jgi:hypothetical protein